MLIDCGVERLARTARLHSTAFTKFTHGVTVMKNAISRCSSLLQWITLTCVALFATPVVAAEPAAPSLQLVPQDASFYFSSLRMKEQLEIVTNSNWWAQVQQNPLYQQMLMMAQMGMLGPESPINQFQVFMQDAENAQLVNVLLDMASEEMFMYGGANVASAFELAQEISNASNRVAMERISRFENGNFDEGDFDSDEEELAVMRAMFDKLNEDLDKVVMPEVVAGFRIQNEVAATAQIDRLEKLLKELIESDPAAGQFLGDQPKREQAGGSEFLTITIDAAKFPMDQIPFEDIAEEPGQYDELKKRLQEVKLVFAVGIHKGYVFFSYGPSLDHLAKLGTDDVLADAPRLDPLRMMGEKRYTGVAFLSEALMRSLATSEQDLDMLADMALAMIPLAEIEDDFKQALAADVPEMKTDLKSLLPTPGDFLSFSFLNGRGYEGYSYDWSSNQMLDASKPLTVLNHLGGKPILAIAARGADRPQDYNMLVKWLKRGKQYFEKYGVPTMPEGDQEVYKQLAAVAYPALQKADQINRKLLLPALADGQCAMVIDGLSTSDQWHMEMPTTSQALPLPMIGLVQGLSDADKFKQALGDYRDLADDTLAKLIELAPNDVPPIQIPDAKQEDLADGLTLYSYELPPPFGFDSNVAPNLGITSDFAVLSLLPDQTKRLAKSQPLVTESGPLADTDRPLAMAFYFDFHALIEVGQPWIDEAFEQSVSQGLDQGIDQELIDNMIKQQKQMAASWIKLFKAFHGYSAAASENYDALVTHSEWHIEDVK